MSIKRDKSEVKCNICHYPTTIRYKEIDPETGSIIEKSHEIKCLGHFGIHAALWNKHPKHSWYMKYYAQSRRDSGE